MRALLLSTVLMLPAVLAPALPARAAPEISVLVSEDPILRLGRVDFAGGRALDLTVGIGSAAYHRPGDPADIVYTLSDRGPNFACSEAEAVTGVRRGVLCAADRDGRVYPVPGYAPSLYGVRLRPAEGRFEVFESIALKTRRGVPLTGLTNPLPGRTEQPLDGTGARLAFDPSAIDAEGLVRLPDGSAWIGEENGPSLVHVGADGRVLRRVVPSGGTAGELAGADYPVVEGLPAILAKRQSNRGIESLAGTPDGETLYAIVQNPLANPDAAAYRAARNSRVLRYEPGSNRVTGEWVYPLEAPQSFRLDPSDRQTDPRISEAAWLGPDRLLVLERTEKTTKLFEVRLGEATDISGSRWDDAATRPTLEQSNDLAGTGIVPLHKRLVLDSADHPELPVKLEGIALLPDGTLMLINDDDFGISGERTKIVLVRGLALGL
ncbi:esterase-like activity of phytase family protein [Roseomonas haemaphysalidis]|uniref:Esterase-like activity of phytase family protein n=1 Tax=Roseomonas haemaphysalidis TaxID=2768162 RepID=A0ABS3KXJ0_9PROT|nr:esterase-like activity of phytase family protein [Roseomonas haemaphysalidis]MBO1081363.1 esterase-like activity of phytase family protein [Roseomonas haemaphysalidis]